MESKRVHPLGGVATAVVVGAPAAPGAHARAPAARSGRVASSRAAIAAVSAATLLVLAAGQAVRLMLRGAV